MTYLRSSSFSSWSPNQTTSFSTLSLCSQAVFTSRLEAHIDSIKKGNEFYTSGVESELNFRSQDISSALAQTDPKALAMYSGVLGGLRYDRAARFVTNLQFNTSMMASLNSKEQSSRQVEDVLNAYQKSNTSGQEGSIETQAQIKPTYPATIQDSIMEAGGMIQRGEAVPTSLNAALGAYKFAVEYESRTSDIES